MLNEHREENCARRFRMPTLHSSGAPGIWDLPDDITKDVGPLRTCCESAVHVRPSLAAIPRWGCADVCRVLFDVTRTWGSSLFDMSSYRGSRPVRVLFIHSGGLTV